MALRRRKQVPGEPQPQPDGKPEPVEKMLNRGKPARAKGISESPPDPPSVIVCTVCSGVISKTDPKVWSQSINGDGYKHAACAGKPSIPTKDRKPPPPAPDPTEDEQQTFEDLVAEGDGEEEMPPQDEAPIRVVSQGPVTIIEEPLFTDEELEEEPASDPVPHEPKASEIIEIEPGQVLQLQAKIFKEPVDLPADLIENLMETVPVAEDDITTSEILGLTDNEDAAKIMGLPLEFDFDRFVKIVKDLPTMIGLPTDYDVKLAAQKIQEWTPDIVRCHAFFEWAHAEAKNNHDTWFDAQVSKAYEAAETWYRQAKKDNAAGKGNQPTKPDLSYIRTIISGSRINQKYLRAINRYAYWLKFLKRLGIDALQRKSFLIMNLNKNSLRIPESRFSDFEEMGQDINPASMDPGDDPLGIGSAEEPENLTSEQVIRMLSSEQIVGSDPVDPPVDLEPPVPSKLSKFMLESYPWMKQFPDLESAICNVCHCLVFVRPGDKSRNTDGKEHQYTCKNPNAAFSNQEPSVGDDVDFDLEDDASSTPSKKPTIEPKKPTNDEFMNKLSLGDDTNADATQFNVEDDVDIEFDVDEE